MSTSKRRLPPIYRKPARVPATPEVWDAWARQQSDLDPLGRMLDEWGHVLREMLEREGVPVEQGVPSGEREARIRRRLAVRSVDGGHVWYREADVAPAVLEAIDALAAVENVRRLQGDFRVLAAFDLGAAIERLRATQAWSRAIDSYRRSHQPTVTDDQVRAAVAKYKTRADAAAALGISTRRLQDRCKALGQPTKRNRKPTTSDA